MYLCGRKEGVGRMNYYVISMRGCKKRKEIEEAYRVRENKRNGTIATAFVLRKESLTM